MAIIGFIVLVCIGLFLGWVAIMTLFAGSMFGGSGAEALIPAILAGLVFWAAFHFAPFTIALVGG